MPFKKLDIFSLLPHRKIRKKLIITSLVFFGLFVGLLVSNSIFNLSRIDMQTLENSAERILKKQTGAPGHCVCHRPGLHHPETPSGAVPELHRTAAHVEPLLYRSGGKI